MPAGMIAVDTACPLRTALKKARAGVLNLYIVYKNGVPIGFTDDRHITEICLRGKSDSPIGQMPLFMPASQRSEKAVPTAFDD